MKTAQDSWAFSPRSLEVLATVGSGGRVDHAVAGVGDDEHRAAHDGLDAVVVADGEILDRDGLGSGNAGEEKGGSGEELHFDDLVGWICEIELSE